QEAKAKLAARNARVGRANGAVPKVPDPEQARPAPSAQRNFTDPDSRIMKDPATKSFEQAYSAQAAVDGHRQIIVACSLSQSADDTAPFVPMLEQVQANVGRLPAVAMADAGFSSDPNRRSPQPAAIDRYVPPDRTDHGTDRRTPLEPRVACLPTSAHVAPRLFTCHYRDRLLAGRDRPAHRAAEGAVGDDRGVLARAARDDDDDLVGRGHLRQERIVVGDRHH